MRSTLQNNLQLQRGDRTADLRIVLSVRRFRRARGGESLEARIIPKRIEHRIEPEQRRSERHVSVQRALARHRE